MYVIIINVLKILIFIKANFASISRIFDLLVIMS